MSLIAIHTEVRGQNHACKGLGYISVLLELYTMKAGLTMVGINWRSNPRKSVVIVLEVHCGRSIIHFMINVSIMLLVIIIRQVS